MGIKQVGVIGAGVMGHGIAQVCAQVAKTEVILRDVSEELVQRGLEDIRRFLQGTVDRGRITKEEAEEVLSRIKITTRLEDVKDADLIIEAIPEDMDLKKGSFAELEDICGKDTIFATNTSMLSITEMASVTKRADRFAGMHWFNPPQLMRLIEVVSGSETSSDTANTLMDFAVRLGKTPITVKDSPGFVVNRILQPWYNEAFSMIDENITTPEDIDAAYRAFGFRMGPCQQRDLVGHDTGLAVTSKLYEEFGDTRFRPPMVIRKLVRAGRLGRKSGKGFYDYDETAGYQR